MKSINIESIEILLKKGVDPNGTLENPLLKKAMDYFSKDKDNSIEMIKLLLKYGASTNFGSNDEMQDDILSYAILETHSLEVVKLLLENGSNTAMVDTNGRTALGNAIFINSTDIASLLLEFGARVSINFYHPFTLSSVLDQAIIHSGLDMIQLVLDNGADTCMQKNIDEVIEELEDFSEYVWTKDKDFNKAEYSAKEYSTLKELLEQDDPPYLKLGENKYIIYENKVFNDEINIYLLTDKKKYKDKKYLYADNKIDAFIYWAYTQNLLVAPVMEAVAKYLSAMGQMHYKEMYTLIKSIIGDKLTIEVFTEAGQKFATAYLTVTHWWYSLHYDFNNLYQDKGKIAPRAINSQNELEMLIRLLNIRYIQYRNGEDFNANQNREQITTLITNEIFAKGAKDRVDTQEENINHNIILDDFLIIG